MKKIISIRWSGLHSLSQARIVTSMYIWLFVVPVMAKVMSLTSDVATVTVFSYTFDIHLSLPFSWKMFYLAAFFFALAALVFKARCPKIIQEHISYSSYENEGKPHWHLKAYAEEMAIDYWKYKDQFLKNKRLYQIAEPDSIEDEESYTDKQNLFWHLHQDANKSRRPYYCACLVSYTLGFICMFVVFVQNMYWVASTLNS